MGMTTLEGKLAKIVWYQEEYDNTERPFYQQTADSLLKDDEVQAAIERVKNPADSTLILPESGVYTVRAMVNLKPKRDTNLSWDAATRWIQNQFEKSQGAVHFASIERVA